MIRKPHIPGRIYKYLCGIFKIRSIQTAITLSFTSVIILSLLFISLMLYGMFSDNAEKNAAFSTGQIMDQVNLNLNSYLKGMMQISDLIRNNLSGEVRFDKSGLAEILAVTSRIRNDIVTVSIFSDTGRLLLSNPSGDYDKNFDAAGQDWFKPARERPAEYIFVPPHVQRLFRNRRPWVVSLCRSVTFYENDHPVTRVTMVDMNFSTIEQLCSQVSLGKRGYIYIVDQNGNIIYHPQQQIVYAGLKSENIAEALSRSPGSYFDDFQGERRIMTVKNISPANWIMVGISYVDELIPNKRNLNNFVVFISMFGITFAVMASMFISARISQPIKRLEKQMKRVENGDFDISIETDGEDEVKQLSRAFNLMVVKIKQLMGQIISEQEAKRKSEFKALQAQINPHFLYNTLSLISWKAIREDAPDISEIANNMAEYYRTMLNDGGEAIQLRDEMRNIRAYLSIQLVAHQESFSVEYDVPEELEDFSMINMVLQPLVENAVRHGVDMRPDGGGIICVSARREKDDLLLTVEDNGPGMVEKTQAGILKKEAGGYGVRNVHERIQLYSGEGYGLSYESSRGKGTRVMVRLPVHLGETGE